MAADRSAGGALASPGSASSSRQAGQQLAGSPAGALRGKSPLGHYLRKLQQGDAAAWEKDELLNLIYWWRQGAGVAIGLLLGATGVTGIMGVFMFFAISIGVTMAIYKNVLGVDEEDYGGHGDLVFEGMMGSFASFLVAWILTYTAMHDS